MAVAMLAADLIVIGTHGRKGLSHLFLGSVGEGVDVGVVGQGRDAGFSSEDVGRKRTLLKKVSAFRFQ